MEYFIDAWCNSFHQQVNPILNQEPKALISSSLLQERRLAKLKEEK